MKDWQTVTIVLIGMVAGAVATIIILGDLGMIRPIP